MKKIISERKDILLFLFVNFFMIDWKITLFSLFIALYIGYSLDVTNPLLEEFLAGIALLILAFFAILRLVILPITYGYLERNSKSLLIVNFIKKLKTSFKWKFGILLLTLISPLVMELYKTTPDENKLFSILFLLFLLSTPSYLALYLWWWIEDKIKKRKS